MNHRNQVLVEEKGSWLLQGVALKIGDHIRIDGVSWKVLGFGRSQNDSQMTFLWIQNDRFGITVYFPSSEESHSSMLLYSEGQAVA